MENIKKSENLLISESEYLDNSLNNIIVASKPSNKIISNEILEEKPIDKDLLLKYKKINEEAKAKSKWGDMDELVLENMINQFTAYSDDNGIEWDKFDYSGDYDEEYYRKKFPLFDDNTIAILVKCSKSKVEDHRIPSMKKIEGEHIVEFN